MCCCPCTKTKPVCSCCYQPCHRFCQLPRRFRQPDTTDPNEENIPLTEYNRENGNHESSNPDIHSEPINEDGRENEDGQSSSQPFDHDLADDEEPSAGPSGLQTLNVVSEYGQQTTQKHSSESLEISEPQSRGIVEIPPQDSGSQYTILGSESRDTSSQANGQTEPGNDDVPQMKNWLISKLDAKIRGTAAKTKNGDQTLQEEENDKQVSFNEHGFRFDNSSKRWYLELKPLEVKEIRAKVWQVKLDN